ncbi:rhomboid family intramembrane serine protease [Salinimonas lutimaris]|uniref:rhomboid family intramembrane serine protease n=1 Tax=Salinimonas lutimaris TaxID=914153 RepID=UPI0010C14FA2|nr:rhomboid family intramembrane serine protease [Salinimonas lutimaris]
MQNCKPIWLKHTILPMRSSLNLDINPTGLSEYTAIKKWQPQSAALIEDSQFSRLVPPIFSTEFQQIIYTELKKRYQKLLIVYLIVTSAICILSISTSGLKSLGWPAFFIFTTLIYLSEYKSGITSILGLKERALFFYWLYEKRNIKLATLRLSSLLIITCLPQIILGITHYPDYAFDLYGAVYYSIDKGELWRIITGAYLHYSPIHFLTNFFLALSVGVLSERLLGMKILLVFFAGNTIGVFTQYYFGSHELDSCGGISFGFYSLLSFLIAYNMWRERLFPSGFGLSLILILLMCFIFAELTSDNSASSGHIGSIIAGVIIAKTKLKK